MKEKYYYEYAIDEIMEIIKINIMMLYNLDDRMLELKKYCKNKEEKYQKLDYYKLIYFVEEALTELINTEYLYDFRKLDYR